MVEPVPGRRRGHRSFVLTDDPRFVLFKPSVIYVIVGVVMLKPGWMNRYLPPIAKQVAPDIGVIVGFAWAGLMFASAAINAFVALTSDVQTWAIVMPIYGIASKLVVFLSGFAALRWTTRRRVRAMPAQQRDELLRAMGYDAEVPSASRAA